MSARATIISTPSVRERRQSLDSHLEEQDFNRNSSERYPHETARFQRCPPPPGSFNWFFTYAFRHCRRRNDSRKLITDLLLMYREPVQVTNLL